MLWLLVWALLCQFSVGAPSEKSAEISALQSNSDLTKFTPPYSTSVIPPTGIPSFSLSDHVDWYNKLSKYRESLQRDLDGLPAVSSVESPPLSEDSEVSQIANDLLNMENHENDMGFSALMKDQEELQKKQQEVNEQRDAIAAAEKSLAAFKEKLASDKAVLSRNEANMQQWIQGFIKHIKQYQDKVSSTFSAEGEGGEGEEGGEAAK